MKLGLHLLTRDEARKLMPLLEEEKVEAGKYVNKEYQRILSGLLEVLNMYLVGKINLYESNIDVLDKFNVTKLSNV